MTAQAITLKDRFAEVGIAPASVTGMAEHTAEVQPGFAFVATAPSAQSVRQHVDQACAQGAALVLLDSSSSLAAESIPVPSLRIPQLGQHKGTLAAEFYGEPSRQMMCLGVTGTNGKTSTAFYLADLLQKVGFASAYCGTLGVGRLDHLQYDEQAMTTPNAVALQRILHQFCTAGVQWVALEISSHALDQQRAQGVSLRCGIFTNLSRDHLDYHQSMQAYGQAKARLFQDFDLEVAVINQDDEFGQELIRSLNPSVQLVTYGEGADWSWCRNPEQPAQVSWVTPYGEFSAQVNLVADYQIANLTAALAALVASGVDIAALFSVVPMLAAVPGRLELVSQAVTAPASQPQVLVDFAHTPDALAKVLNSLRHAAAGRLFCVVGCGGDRDRGKRSLMAQAALQGSDQVWFTSDNPRSESPQTIVDDMLADVTKPQQTQVNVELDRRQAIHQAVAAAGAADTVLIAGKGDERYQEIAGVKYDFDDREVAHAAIQARRDS